MGGIYRQPIVTTKTANRLYVVGMVVCDKNILYASKRKAVFTKMLL